LRRSEPNPFIHILRLLLVPIIKAIEKALKLLVASWLKRELVDVDQRLCSRNFPTSDLLIRRAENGNRLPKLKGEGGADYSWPEMAREVGILNSPLTY
jgi:hypothetical protein